ncbi:thiamin pyrophosphokinase, putative [Eimeria mitis]|uniref:Thiamin pyrophosphokinase, putative n=1 Tax=Eimeria mitis TaxID=44415 RepID=U6JSR8_9EIME|nr:thiamin pyrophosphokinase, putative [Eimeria mitis]CDJ27826.1 thiamin pyrophosphokinase, putative [Eimeria mitis]
MFLNSRLLFHARILKALYVQPHATLPSQPYLQHRRTFTAVDPSFASTAPVMPPPSASSGRLHANKRRLQHCNTESRSSSSNGSRINSNRSSNDRMLTTVHDLRLLETVWGHREISAAPAYAEAAAVEAKAADASAAASGRGRVVVLLLNRPFPSYVHGLLENAWLVVAADGAANHMLPLYRAVEAKQQQQQQQQQEQEVQQQQQQVQELPGGMTRNAQEMP